jgi:peptide/nickel transport system permease protein
MLRFALTRIVMALPTLLIVAVVGLRPDPPDPGRSGLPDAGRSGDAGQPGRSAHRLGLDQSLPTQFGIWFGNLLKGDLGQSINSQEAVLPLILSRFWVSAQIVLVAVLLASLVAVPAGVIAAWRQDSALDLGLVGTATLLLSIPTFWLGLLLLLFFGLKLEWLPVVGYVSIGDDPWPASLPDHADPDAVPARDRRDPAHGAGLDARGAAARLHHPCPRQGPDGDGGALAPRLQERLRADLDADRPRARQSAGRHRGRRNRLHHPRPGPAAGRCDLRRDYPVIQGCMLFVAFVYVLVNLVIDLCYPIFDPEGDGRMKTVPHQCADRRRAHRRPARRRRHAARSGRPTIRWPLLPREARRPQRRALGSAPTNSAATCSRA